MPPEQSTRWSLDLEGLVRGQICGTLKRTDEAADVPALELCVDGAAVADIAMSPKPDGSQGIAAELPLDRLDGGVTTFTFREKSSGAVLAVFPIRAGAALGEDVVADLAILTAELDALKRAFLADANEPKLRAIEKELIVAEAVEAALAAMRRATSDDTDRTPS